MRLMKGKTSVLLGLVMIALALAGCNQVRKPAKNTTGTITDPTVAPSSTAAGDTYVVSSIGLDGSGNFSILLDTKRSPGSLRSHCDPQGAKPCVCTFEWTEINNTSGSTSVKRSGTSVMTVAQPAAASCPPFQAYSTEINDGTQLKISIGPGPGNPDVFTSVPFNYNKGQSNLTGAFQADGVYFDNILHYSCYFQFQKGSIKSYMYKYQNPNPTSANTESTDAPSASRFCVTKAFNLDGTSNADDPNCIKSTLTPSARAYYFNLFIPETEKSDINQGNAVYTCPFVKDTAETQTNAPLKAWPLDKTFALAVTSTGNYTVPIEGYKRPTVAGQASSSSCQDRLNGTASSTSSDDKGTTLFNGCMGFAARPNSDGSCPLLPNGTNGQTRRTYRLRRYMAIYPPVFDADGYKRQETQMRDFIYIIDRPLTSPVPADPLSYSMLGPKPCPYAFFDAAAMTSSANPPIKQYTATNSNSWNGRYSDGSTFNRNIDNLQFPNTDSATSCSAMLPLVNSTKTLVSVVTISDSNPNSGSSVARSLQTVYIRPSAPWYPHYEEDTDFLACAPLADTDNSDKTLGYKEAPIHITKNNITKNQAWCTEAYPSQNDNISAMEGSDYTGVIPFTSHVVKGVTGGVDCKAVKIGTSGREYHSASVSWADGKSRAATCDRSYASVGLDKGTPPLLAPSADVENVLAQDSSYQCLVSFDKDSVKTARFAPSEGCCGLSVPGDARSTAHVEPGYCKTPKY